MSDLKEMREDIDQFHAEIYSLVEGHRDCCPCHLCRVLAELADASYWIDQAIYHPDGQEPHGGLRDGA